MISGFSPSLMLAIIFIGIISVLIGSFIGMLTYRLPLMLKHSDSTPSFNLAVPRSHCPHCQTPLKIWHNIPLVSYLLLRGRCGFCKTPISIQYFLIELSCFILSIFLTLYFGLTWQLLGAIIFTDFLIAMIAIDLKHQLLPDELTLSLLWLGLAFNLFSVFTPLSSAVIGAISGYLSLWLFTHVYYWLRGKWGMGHGDFKLFAAIGAWLGWAALPYVIFLAAISGLVISLLMLWRKKQNWQNPVAFGPYLALGGYLMLLMLKFSV